MINSLGLAANLVGVVFLFRYGMPYRITAGSGEIITTENKGPKEAKLDARYTRLGYLGLALFVVGTILQIVTSR